MTTITKGQYEALPESEKQYWQDCGDVCTPVMIPLQQAVEVLTYLHKHSGIADMQYYEAINKLKEIR